MPEYMTPQQLANEINRLRYSVYALEKAVGDLQRRLNAVEADNKGLRSQNERAFEAKSNSPEIPDSSKNR
jgi:uncharacterized protein YlxW (UPF0749 family)